MDSLAGTRSFVLCGTQDPGFATGFQKETPWFGAGSCDWGCWAYCPSLHWNYSKDWALKENRLGCKRGERTWHFHCPWGKTLGLRGNQKDHCKCRVSSYDKQRSAFALALPTWHLFVGHECFLRGIPLVWFFFSALRQCCQLDWFYGECHYNCVFIWVFSTCVP